MLVRGEGREELQRLNYLPLDEECFPDDLEDDEFDDDFVEEDDIDEEFEYED